MAHVMLDDKQRRHHCLLFQKSLRQSLQSEAPESPFPSKKLWDSSSSFDANASFTKSPDLEKKLAVVFDNVPKVSPQNSSGSISFHSQDDLDRNEDFEGNDCENSLAESLADLLPQLPKIPFHSKASNKFDAKLFSRGNSYGSRSIICGESIDVQTTLSADEANQRATCTSNRRRGLKKDDIAHKSILRSSRRGPCRIRNSRVGSSGHDVSFANDESCEKSVLFRSLQQDSNFYNKDFDLDGDPLRREDSFYERSERSRRVEHHEERTSRLQQHLQQQPLQQPQRKERHPHKYTLGESLRSRNDIIHDKGQSTRNLQTRDFVFVKRSNGQWTYAIVAARFTPEFNGEEESILLVLDSSGRTKNIGRSKWEKCLRCVVT